MLSIRIDNAQAAQVELKSNEYLTSRQRRELERLVADGQEAVKTFIIANIRLVVSIAGRYPAKGALDQSDMVSEGIFGLRRAVQKFDHTKGFKFSTYANNWIRQAIIRAIADQDRSIRIPVHKLDDIKALEKHRLYLVGVLKREPTNEELAKRAKLDIEEVVKLSIINKSVLSLSTLVGANGDVELGEFVESKDQKIDDAAVQQIIFDDIIKSLENFTPIERKVIIERFGLRGTNPRTLREIAIELGISVTTVQNIERRVKTELERNDKLRGYYDSLV